MWRNDSWSKCLRVPRRRSSGFTSYLKPGDVLTYWGRMTHICVGNLTTIGPDNGLSPGRRQAIIWTNAGILLIGLWGTNFSEILIGIQTFSFTKMHLKMSSAKWRPFCLGLNMFMHQWNGSLIVQVMFCQLSVSFPKYFYIGVNLIHLIMFNLIQTCLLTMKLYFFW